MTVHIVVDSTSDIDKEHAQRYGITVVPLTVSFGDQDYLDGVTLGNAEFYQKLATSVDLPKTSTPSITQFEDAYTNAIKAGATGILSIHLSGALSGTLNTATLAAQTVRDKTKVPITLIDSRTVSAGFGYPAMLAAERAKSGASLDELAAYVQTLLDHGKSYFVLDTLDNLQKGGRIGKASAVFGMMLSIKPILGIRDGEVVSLERIRTRAKALNRIIDLVKEQPIQHLALAASDDATAQEFAAMLHTFYPGEIPYFKLGAVIGTHAGPRAVGLFVFEKS